MCEVCEGRDAHIKSPIRICVVFFDSFEALSKYLQSILLFLKRRVSLSMLHTEGLEGLERVQGGDRGKRVAGRRKREEKEEEKRKKETKKTNTRHEIAGLIAAK
jgi:hypothetical protein